MTLADLCPAQANLAQIAGFYAQMTGVLAGFAFTALVVLMTPTQVDERRNRVVGKGDSVILALFAAFISLLIATLTYSVLGGEDIPDSQAKASTLELIDGVPFGLSVIMLFHGVTLLIQGSNVERTVIWTARAMTVVVVPTIAYFYIASGSQDTVLARHAKGRVNCSSVPPVGMRLSLALLVFLIISIIPGLQVRSWRRAVHRLRTAAPIAVLLTSVVAALVAGEVATRSPDFVMSPTALNMYLAGTFVIFLALSVFLAYGYSSVRPHREADLMMPRTPASLIAKLSQAPGPLPVGFLVIDGMTLGLINVNDQIAVDGRWWPVLAVTRVNGWVSARTPFGCSRVEGFANVPIHLARRIATDGALD